MEVTKWVVQGAAHKKTRNERHPDDSTVYDVDIITFHIFARILQDLRSWCTHISFLLQLYSVAEFNSTCQEWHARVIQALLPIFIYSEVYI